MASTNFSYFSYVYKHCFLRGDSEQMTTWKNIYDIRTLEVPLIHWMPTMHADSSGMVSYHDVGRYGLYSTDYTDWLYIIHLNKPNQLIKTVINCFVHFHSSFNILFSF